MIRFFSVCHIMLPPEIPAQAYIQCLPTSHIVPFGSRLGGGRWRREVAEGGVGGRWRGRVGAVLRLFLAEARRELVRPRRVRGGCLWPGARPPALGGSQQTNVRLGGAHSEPQAQPLQWLPDARDLAARAGHVRCRGGRKRASLQAGRGGRENRPGGCATCIRSRARLAP